MFYIKAFLPLDSPLTEAIGIWRWYIPEATYHKFAIPQNDTMNNVLLYIYLFLLKPVFIRHDYIHYNVFKDNNCKSTML